MKKTVLFGLFFWAMCLCGLAQEQVTIRDFQGQRITGVNAGGVFQILITQGGETGVALTVPAKLKDKFVLSINERGVVNISSRGEFKLKNGEKLTVRIGCSSLEKIELGGACKLEGEGNFTGQRLVVDLSGAAKAKIDGYCDIVEKTTFDLSGASAFSGRINTPGVNMNVSGAAHVTVAGEAKAGRMEFSGAVKADLADFIVESLTAEVSGAANLQCYVRELFNIEVSGAGKCTYRGNPKVNRDVSRSASLKQVGGGEEVLPN